MTDVRAADLPETSIVAAGAKVYFKIPDVGGPRWRSVDVRWDFTAVHDDADVDAVLAGQAQVLRVGGGDPP